MRIKLSILLSLFILFESIYLLFGDGSISLWRVFYYFNPSMIIIGSLSVLSGYFDTFLIDIVIGLSSLKVAYNFVLFTNKDLAENMNTCFWVGLLIVLINISVLINKLIKICRQK